jgi:uncharacterized membrane protein YidH (DUF202 family)
VTSPGSAAPGPRDPERGDRRKPARAGLERRAPDGASAARTRLAWRRTVLAATVVALLTVRIAVRDGHNVLDSAAIVLASAGWLAQLWLAQRRIHAMAAHRPRDIRRSLPAFALVVAGFAVLGLILVGISDWHGA